MRLIGMLDSPYVRRTAIAARLLGIAFEHDPLSVFSTFDRFSRINPVVKAPTLVCDDGTVLMDSGLIVDHLETLAGRSLWPAAGPERLRALRIVGLALAACEKVVQIVYENHLRPADKQHAPWLERVHKQMLAALTALDAELARHLPAGRRRDGPDPGRPQRRDRVALHADQAGDAGGRRAVPGARRLLGARGGVAGVRRDAAGRDRRRVDAGLPRALDRSLGFGERIELVLFQLAGGRARRGRAKAQEALDHVAAPAL